MVYLVHGGYFTEWILLCLEFEYFFEINNNSLYNAMPCSKVDVWLNNQIQLTQNIWKLMCVQAVLLHDFICYTGVVYQSR